MKHTFTLLYLLIFTCTLSYSNSSLLKMLKKADEVKELTIDSEEVNMLLENTKAFRQLQHLTIKGGYLNRVPQGIAQLETLQSLTLENIHINGIDHAIGNMPAMKALKCKNVTGLHAFNQGDHQWNGIEHVEFIRMNRIPSDLHRLSGLQQLIIFKCESTELPQGINQLASLKELTIERTPILHLPDSLGAMMQLEKLVLNKTMVLEIREELCDLNALHTLIVRTADGTTMLHRECVSGIAYTELTGVRYIGEDYAVETRSCDTSPVVDQIIFVGLEIFIHVACEAIFNNW